uniref:ATP synthase F0 subunit beta n=1 Tax=Prototheca zopfii TaxID=3112 RepID=A0A2P1G7I7_9CHLO|nr:ATP synthase F0 subunit beta [Prototheca ciferrii]AVM80913.1 ATP synthase F0 subunit beta [Prototheca ciferrii]
MANIITTSNSKLFLYGFLIFCVASSKHIIIYNEEILVALSFFGFIYFIVSNYSEPIVSIFDEKATTTLQDYQEAVKNQTQNLVELREQFQTLTLLSSAVSSIKDKTVSELSSYDLDVETQIQFLQNEKNFKTLQHFKSLALVKQSNLKELRQKFADSLEYFLLKEIKSLSKKEFKRATKNFKTSALKALNTL